MIRQHRPQIVFAPYYNLPIGRGLGHNDHYKTGQIVANAYNLAHLRKAPGRGRAAPGEGDLLLLHPARHAAHVHRGRRPSSSTTGSRRSTATRASSTTRTGRGPQHLPHGARRVRVLRALLGLADRREVRRRRSSSTVAAQGRRSAAAGEGRGAAAVTPRTADAGTDARWNSPGDPAGSLLLAAPAPQARPAARTAASTQLADEFLGEWLARRPHVATRLGDHTHDSRAAAVTPQSVASRRRSGCATSASCSRRDSPRELSFERQLDRDVLLSRIERELLTLSEVRTLARATPTPTSTCVAGSIQSLLQRDFALAVLAPPCRRPSACAQVPEVLRAARAQSRPSAAHLRPRSAIRQFEGVLTLLPRGRARGARRRVPRAAAPGRSRRGRHDGGAGGRGVHRLRCSEDLLPRSDSSFALGADALRAQARRPTRWRPRRSTRCSRAAWRELDGHRRAHESAGGAHRPGRRRAGGARFAGARRARRARAGAVRVSSELDAIRAFLREKELLTLPAHENLIVRETPPFRRSLSFASMDAPGVWEQEGHRGLLQRDAGRSGLVGAAEARPPGVLQPLVGGDRLDPRGAARPLLPVPRQPQRAVADPPGLRQRERQRRGLGALLRADGDRGRASATATRATSSPSCASRSSGSAASWSGSRCTPRA